MKAIAVILAIAVALLVAALRLMAGFCKDLLNTITEHLKDKQP